MAAISFLLFITAGVLWGISLFIRFRRQNKKISEQQEAIKAQAQENAALNARIHNFQERKTNEKNYSSTGRDELIERLRKSGDLRD